jgi:DNA-binding FadR family transcriptional regulator
MADATFERLPRAPVYQVVAERIRAAIVSGEIPQGRYLPTEQELARQLGVTRQTVRESIRLLETAGLIERGKQRRLRAGRPSQEAVSASYHEAMLLHGITYRELWEWEMALDPGVAALAAERCTPEMAKLLEANLCATESVIAEPNALAEVDVEFHRLVAETTANRAIQLARTPAISLLYPAYGNVIRAIGPGRRLLHAHTRIVAAITSGDPDMAREWMSKHIRDFKRGCELAGFDLDEPVTVFDTSSPAALSNNGGAP